MAGIHGTGRAPRLFERVAAPLGGRNVAWQPSARRGRCSRAVSVCAWLPGSVRRPLRRQASLSACSCASLWGWTPRKQRLGGVPHGVAVDDGGVGLWPA